MDVVKSLSPNTVKEASGNAYELLFRSRNASKVDDNGIPVIASL